MSAPTVPVSLVVGLRQPLLGQFGLAGLARPSGRDRANLAWAASVSAMHNACGAVSLRRHCPDQVPGGRW